jgi:hypothetical protein
MGVKRNACRILVRKPEGNRPLRRPRHRWVDNIKVREIGGGGTGWIDLAQYGDQGKVSFEHCNELLTKQIQKQSNIYKHPIL